MRKFKSVVKASMSPKLGGDFDKESDDVESFLESCELAKEKISDLHTFLEDDLEVTSLEELQDLEEDEILKPGNYI